MRGDIASLEMDQETWRFINTFAPWLAALGTFSAVVTSLYLARRGNRIQLEVRAGLRQVGFIGGTPETFGAPENPPELVWTEVTNVGRRSANINRLYWRPLPWRKRGLAWFPARNHYSSAFPITLVDGESANYPVAVPEFEEKNRQLFHGEFSGLSGAIKLRLLRVCVGTSTGDVFSCKPEKELRELLRKIATTSPTLTARASLASPVTFTLTPRRAWRYMCAISSKIRSRIKMAEKQKRRFSWDEFFGRVRIAIIGYGLFFLGWYFQIASFFHAVNIFAFTSELMSLLGVIFTTLGLIFYTTMHNFLLLAKQAEAILGTSDNVGRVVDLVGSIVEMLPLVDSFQSAEEKNRTQAAMDTLRRELKESSELRIKDAEVRLRGEWRFVVGLMVAILFGFLTLFLAVKK